MLTIAFINDNLSSAYAGANIASIPLMTITTAATFAPFKMFFRKFPSGKFWPYHNKTYSSNLFVDLF